MSQDASNFFLDEDEEESADHFNLSDHLGSPEAGFTNMLRYGILSLQLLPKNSSSGQFGKIIVSLFC